MRPPRADGMRLFIGIPLPGEYARVIGALQTAWKERLASRVSWVRPELAHVTLKFLGEVEERRVADIVGAMRAARWTQNHIFKKGS